MLASHDRHVDVVAWAKGRRLCLAGHALAETYSVLTRLPGDARVAPDDAVALIEENIAKVLPLSDAGDFDLVRTFADKGVAGGAVYDGLVALAAREHGATLATRDARARSTYDALGVPVEVVDESSS